MNCQQKDAIKQHQLQLMQDIIPTERLFAALYQNRVFDENMIEMIKAERTNTDQVSKMLNMLPKRGPDAFDGFIKAIQDDYPWLTALLISTANQTQAIMTRDNTKCSVKTEADITSRQTSVKQSPDPIKTKVSMFVHKQFGQSKRISQADKKAIEKWLADQIQQERKCVQPHSCDCESANNTMEKTSSTEHSEVLQTEFQNKLNELHKKCEPHLNLVQHEINNNEEDRISLCDTPRDITLTVIEIDLDFILDKLAKLESQITQIHELLDDPEKKFFTTNLVKEIKQQNKQYEKKLNQKKQKNKNMLTELYENSNKIKKLEQKLEHLQQQMKSQVDLKNDEIITLRHEKSQLQQKYESLHHIHLDHTEKQKTIENLRKLVNDLQESKLNGENVNNRQKVDSTVPRTKKPLGTGSTRQGSIVNQPVQNSSKKGRPGKTSPIKRQPHLRSRKP